MSWEFKAYPDGGRRIAWVATKDSLAAGWLAAWGYAGWWVHGEVLRTMAVADGLRGVGEALNSAFASVSGIWGALAVLPGLGGLFGKQAAPTPGDGLVSLAGTLQQDIPWVALGAGLLVAAPLLLVVLGYIPARWRSAREMGATAAFVRGALAAGQSEQAQALLAYRALARLPFRVLMRGGGDPIGEVMGRRYERLAAAMLEGEGLSGKRLGGEQRARLGPAQEPRALSLEAAESPEIEA